MGRGRGQEETRQVQRQEARQAGPLAGLGRRRQAPQEGVGAAAEEGLGVLLQGQRQRQARLQQQAGVEQQGLLQGRRAQEAVMLRRAAAPAPACLVEGMPRLPWPGAGAQREVAGGRGLIRLGCQKSLKASRE